MKIQTTTSGAPKRKLPNVYIACGSADSKTPLLNNVDSRREEFYRKKRRALAGVMSWVQPFGNGKRDRIGSKTQRWRFLP